MFGNGAMFGMNGDNYAPVFICAFNRTGATLLKGQIARADIGTAGTAAQAETTGTAPHTGNPAGAFNNVATIVQALDTNGTPCYVCADNSIADNAYGKFVKCGECEIAVLDDDAPSTTNVAKGDRLSLLVSESTTGVTAWVTGGARTVGLALEDAAATSGTVARTVDTSHHLRWCLFWGGVAGLGTTDT